MRSRALGLILAVSPACRPEGSRAEPKTLTVAAAISLKEPLEALAREYEAKHPGTRVSLDLGASGDLATRIASGAPVDVFVSASREPIERLHVTERCVVAENALVLVRRPGVVLGWDDLVEKSARIAMGLRQTVPAGAYAEEALEKLGKWDAAKPKVVRAANVRAVLDLVARGEADCGFVYATDARGRADVVLVGEPPEHARPKVVCPLVSVSGAGNELADFLCGSRRAFTERGFR